MHPTTSMLNKPWSDKDKLDYYKTNWLNTFTNQIIYKDKDFKNINGYTDKDANYKDKGSTAIKTKFMFATNVVYKGTNYIGGVFFSKGWGNHWRLITVTDAGFEVAFFGADGSTDDKIPATKWVNYDSFGIVFGYLDLINN